MKKVIFSFFTTVIISFASFANTPTLENDIEIKNENQIEVNTLKVNEVVKNDETVCTITCSDTYNGITYTATAGNWFTSCRQAASRCLEKLAFMGYE